MNLHFFPGVALAAVLLVPPVHGAALPAGEPAALGFDPSRLERVHRLVQGYIDQGKYAGAITLIARDGRIADVRAYGLRDVARNLPMTRDTLVYAFSLTKIVIAVTALTLYEEGRFNLDEPVSDFLPEFKHMKVITGGTPEQPVLVDARPITIRHLLTHTSGFAYDFTASPALKPYYQRTDIFRYATLPEFARAYAQIPLNHQPGEAFTYGANFDVLCYLIEVLTKLPLETVVHDRVFAPLGMNDSYFTVPPEKRARMAVVQEHGPDGKFVAAPLATAVARATGGNLFPTGSAGLVTTADDFARLAQMLLNRGTLDGVRVLGPKTVAFMTTDHLRQIKTPTNFMGPAGSYGLGVGVWASGSGSDSPGSTGRFGWTGAATTYCNADPQEGTIAIVFAQHMPYDEFNLFPAFSTSMYQALVESRAR